MCCEEANGRLIKQVSSADSAFTLETDLVPLALGFTVVEDSPLWQTLGLVADKGRLPGDGGQHGMYVCGDAANGPGLVVRAIRDGLSVAKTALRALTAFELPAATSYNFKLHGPGLGARPFRCRFEKTPAFVNARRIRAGAETDGQSTVV